MLTVVSDVTNCRFDSHRSDPCRRNVDFVTTLLSRRVLRPADILGLLFYVSTNVHTPNYPVSSTVKISCNFKSMKWIIHAKGKTQQDGHPIACILVHHQFLCFWLLWFSFVVAALSLAVKAFPGIVTLNIYRKIFATFSVSVEPSG